MYYCPDCGYEFENPQKTLERHGFTDKPFEKLAVCPDCGGTDFYEKNSTHCRCCGSRLSESQSDYCSETCKRKGLKLWKREQKRRKIRNYSPINTFIAELTLFNLQNNTELSYGQYESKKYLEEQKEKCSKKKRNS